MKVYTVYVGTFSAEPKLYAAEAAKATKQFYLLEFPANDDEFSGRDAATYAAFRYRHRLPKDEALLSPEAAWTHFVERARAEKQDVENKLNVARQRVVLGERELMRVRAELVDAGGVPA